MIWTHRKRAKSKSLGEAPCQHCCHFKPSSPSISCNIVLWPNSIPSKGENRDSWQSCWENMKASNKIFNNPTIQTSNTALKEVYFCAYIKGKQGLLKGSNETMKHDGFTEGWLCRARLVLTFNWQWNSSWNWRNTLKKTPEQTPNSQTNGKVILPPTAPSDPSTWLSHFYDFREGFQGPL